MFKKGLFIFLMLLIGVPFAVRTEAIEDRNAPDLRAELVSFDTGFEMSELSLCDMDQDDFRGSNFQPAFQIAVVPSVKVMKPIHLYSDNILNSVWLPPELS